MFGKGKLMIKRLLPAIICFLISVSAFAAENISNNPQAKVNIVESGVYASGFNTAALQKLFK